MSFLRPTHHATAHPQWAFPGQRCTAVRKFLRLTRSIFVHFLGCFDMDAIVGNPLLVGWVQAGHIVRPRVAAHNHLDTVDLNLVRVDVGVAAPKFHRHWGSLVHA